MTNKEAVAESLLAAMENTSNAVALMTGIKKQFLDQGWSEAAAEQMTVQMLVASSVATAAGR